MKKGLIIGLTVLMALGLSVVFVLADPDLGLSVTGGDLDETTVTAGTDDGELHVNVWRYASPAVGSHHWFDATGGFDATVTVTPGGPGLMATYMHGESRSAASFYGGGSQDFGVTGGYSMDSWGYIEYHCEGTTSAELETTIGIERFHRKINSSRYSTVKCSGSTGYDAYVEAGLYDRDETPMDNYVAFDRILGPNQDDAWIAYGRVEFWGTGSVEWDADGHHNRCGLLADIYAIEIPDDEPWSTTGAGFFEQMGFGRAGMTNWNGSPVPGPDAFGYQFIYHGSDWDYSAGVSAEGQ